MTDWLTWEADAPDPGGALTADVVTAITAGAESELTNHPIESGSMVTDHRILRPKTITIEFAQSSRPLYEDAGAEWSQQEISPRPSSFQPEGLLALTMLAGQAIAAIGSALGFGGGGSRSIWSLTAASDEDRIVELHDTLIDVLTNAYLCTVSYQGLILPGYVVHSVQLSRSAGESGLARFVVALQEVATVETAASAISGEALSSVASSALGTIPIPALGAQGADQVREDVIGKSWAVDLLEAGGISF